jgi:D-alanyl-D-alanine carboxypeptidase/D-alanyl-D-alanine-endopeptidase (penicillin-binding protein 4)
MIRPFLRRACLLLCLLAAGPSWAQEAPSSLPPAIQRILDGHGLKTAGLSVYVQAVDGSPPLLALNAEVSRSPASVIKLVTTFAALDLLGPAYTWRTEAYLDGALEQDRLRGDLILKGGGDPYLTTERFWTLLRGLRANGLRHIEGDLVIDNSYFEVGPEDPGAFDGQPWRTYNVAPDALLVNLKAVRFRIWRPEAGAPARVTTDPIIENLVVDNRIATGKGPCQGFQRGVAFNLPAGLDGDRAVLSGRFPSGCRDYSLWRTVMAPAEFTYGVFRPIWNELGGSIAGEVRSGRAPEDEGTFSHLDSIPLGEVVRNINKFSNNVMTRQVFLTIGAEQLGVPGTADKARAAIDQWMQDRGLGDAGLYLDNGSGLSRETRITTGGLARMLVQAWQHPFMPEFVSSMALSGTDGTLRNRFRGTPMAGKMHIKTGRLNDVYSIAGYVQARSGRRYVVVAIHNDADVHRGPGKELQDALLSWVYAQ